ncbi:hypothetical protein FRB94_008301 [Tulasnella sp. JGI-2019a]|nr:hypothetical protein FRB94_008301 [Tulasnella sp. JGI-2019a]
MDCSAATETDVPKAGYDLISTNDCLLFPSSFFPLAFLPRTLSSFIPNCHPKFAMNIWDGFTMIGGSLSVRLLICLALMVALGKAARRYIIVPKLTVLKDLEHLGKTRKDGKLPGTAVVCGGSISGLLAAAVCADHYEAVIVVEPEVSATDEHALEVMGTNVRMGGHGAPVPVSNRTRVPQWYAAHVWLPLVYVGLRRLFLNLQEELDHAGIKPFPFLARLGSLPDPYAPTASTAPLSFTTSRGGFEVLLRRLVRGSRHNIQFVLGTATGLKRASDGSNKVDGVSVRTEMGPTLLPAQLVIDATGPVQAGYSKWLRAAGFSHLPARDEYDQRRRAVTGVFTVPPDIQHLCGIPWGYRPGVLTLYAPDATIGETYGLVWYIGERNQAILTISGQEFNDRPHTVAGFRSAVTSLPGYKLKRLPPWIIDFLDFLEEHESECNPFYADNSLGAFSWVKYHEGAVDALPRNFIAVGDAMMNVNPAAGQGASKAVIDVTTLDACLRTVSSRTGDVPKDFSFRFFQSQAPRIKGIWESLKDQDYGFKLTKPVKGETLAVGEFRRSYRRAILRLCAKNPDIYKQILDLAYLMAPPTDALAPVLAVRALIECVRHWMYSTAS